MDSNKDACLDVVFVNEGGYANNPKDPGGATRYGITERTARAHGYKGSMRELPKSTAAAIYTTSFWDTASYKCSQLAAGVDLAVLDFGVNSGPARAGKALKAALGTDATSTIKRIFANRLSFLHALKTWRTFGPWLDAALHYD
jgi:lysozyme family protein